MNYGCVGNGIWDRMKLLYEERKKSVEFCSYHSELMKNRRNSAHSFQPPNSYCLHACQWICAHIEKGTNRKEFFAFFRVFDEKFHMRNAKKWFEEAEEAEKDG